MLILKSVSSQMKHEMNVQFRKLLQDNIQNVIGNMIARLAQCLRVAAVLYREFDTRTEQIFAQFTGSRFCSDCCHM